MFTLASQLPQNVGNEQGLALPISLEQQVPDYTKDHHVHHETKDKLVSFIENEETLLTIGDRYRLLLPANADGGWIQGFDSYTNMNLHCHIHPTKRFLELSQLLSMKVNGIRYPYDVQGLGQEVAVLYPQTYGALHGYLKQRKSLSEVEAASFFRQIIYIIDNAHKNGVALRDLKLKKFVFSDQKRCVYVQGVNHSCPGNQEPTLYVSYYPITHLDYVFCFSAKLAFQMLYITCILLYPSCTCT